MRPEPTVFIVDDDGDVRASLTWLIESAGLPAQGFASAEAFLASSVTGLPGCLVLDLRMPGMDGVALFERLQTLRSLLPVIVLTGHGDVPTAVHLIKQGAFDFVEKPFAEGEILDKVKQALTHNLTLIIQETERAQLRARAERLTLREREVLQRVAQGQANKVMAIELGISEKTVEIHRASVMRKMEARTLADLLRMTNVLTADQGNPL